MSKNNSNNKYNSTNNNINNAYYLEKSNENKKNLIKKFLNLNKTSMNKNNINRNNNSDNDSGYVNSFLDHINNTNNNINNTNNNFFSCRLKNNNFNNNKSIKRPWEEEAKIDKKNFELDFFRPWETQNTELNYEKLKKLKLEQIKHKEFLTDKKNKSYFEKKPLKSIQLQHHQQQKTKTSHNNQSTIFLSTSTPISNFQQQKQLLLLQQLNNSQNQFPNHISPIKLNYNTENYDSTKNNYNMDNLNKNNHNNNNNNNYNEKDINLVSKIKFNENISNIKTKQNKNFNYNLKNINRNEIKNDPIKLINTNYNKTNLNNSSNKTIFSETAVKALEKWYHDNSSDPYLTSAEQLGKLQMETNLEKKQIRKWLSNKRSRTGNTLKINGNKHPLFRCTNN